MIAKKSYFKNKGLQKSVAQYYYNLMEIGSRSKVLDLGCGLGYFGKYKPNSSTEVYGVDNDKLALKEASKYERVEWLDLDKAQLPYESSFFDAVLAKDILEHLQKPWETLAEIRRVLKPGRPVVASVPMPKPRAVWDDYTHIRGFTKKALRELFEDAGFQMIFIKKMGGIPGFGRLGRLISGDRLNLVSLIPWILEFPPCSWLFASSYVIKAQKIDGSTSEQS
jgi:ubiquinone/menaquinone biosynthesis C-methylase UbiE